MLLSGESESSQWLVSYKPSVSGTYAFYLDLPGTDVIEESPYPFELRDAFGEAIPLRLEHAITACPGYLSWVKVYELDAERYHLVLSGEAGDNVQVAVEHLEGFPAELYIDADRDGYGRSGSALSSWCGAASGYSLSDGDCDDEDPLVFPNAEGVCEGSCDNNEGSDGCPGGMGGNGGDNTSGGGAPGRDTAGAGGVADGEPGDPLGGAPGAGASSGSQGNGGAGAAGADGEPVIRDKDSSERSGCSCRVGATPSSGGAGWLLVAAVPFLRRLSLRP
jgi:MYXO-CTERM domain-containing protein